MTHVNDFDVTVLECLQQALVHKQRAEHALDRGDLAAAAEQTSAGLALLGGDAPRTPRVALLNLQGVLHRRERALPASRQSLQEALALLRAAGPAVEPELALQLPPVLNNLGLTLQDMDLHLEAAGCLQEAAERQTDPTTRARVLNNLSISLEERGQVQLAYEQRLAAARAVAGSGGLVELMLAISLGASARNLCRFREALAHLARARELGQGHVHSLLSQEFLESSQWCSHCKSCRWVGSTPCPPAHRKLDVLARLSR
jgi:tetratricopeptide (TPR) repeat protein